MRLCAVNEYPLIERIPCIQVRALESLVAGLWQLTESETSSLSSSSSLSSLSSKSPGKSVKFYDVEVDEKPLIRLLEEEEEEGWEELLEASLEGLGSKWRLSNTWKQKY